MVKLVIIMEKIKVIVKIAVKIIGIMINYMLLLLHSVINNVQKDMIIITKHKEVVNTYMFAQMNVVMILIILLEKVIMVNIIVYKIVKYHKH